MDQNSYVCICGDANKTPVVVLQVLYALRRTVQQATSPMPEFGDAQRSTNTLVQVFRGGLCHSMTIGRRY